MLSHTVAFKMIGLLPESGCDHVLYNVDHLDMIGITIVNHANTPGLEGLLAHARGTRKLLVNEEGVTPLKDPWSSVA